MFYPNIALCGKAGSGKDAVGKYLCEAHGYTRLAFADPLREMGLEVNPIIAHASGEPIHLAHIIGVSGWETAKYVFPEVRRLLQQMGQTVRSIDPDFWVRTLMAKAAAAPGPIVVTDTRYRNEQLALVRDGFLCVRVTRPGAGLSGAAGAHDSETELDGTYADYALCNDGTLETLRARVDDMMAPFGH